MNCPRCNVPMAAKNIGEVEIDECTQCQGMWFDQDELRQAKDQLDSDLNWMDFEIWKHQDRFEVAAQPIKCPRCDVKMVAIHYDNTDVELDYCRQCQGIWLDKGEFGKIIDALNVELTTKDLPDYIKASLKEGKEIVTGPEGSASEWTDFTTVLRLLQYRLFSEKPRLLTELIEGQKSAPIW